MRRIKIPAVLFLLLTLPAIALAGCASSGAQFESADQSTGQNTDQSTEQGLPAPAPGNSSELSGDDSAEQSADGRQVIVTGFIRLTVEDPATAADEAVQVVEQVGGRVDGRSETAADDHNPGRAELTVRIPTSKLTSTLDSLKELGEVVQVNQAEQDVTRQSEDLEARISALRTSVDRLLTLMADADTTADLISIESALSERQANLEAFEAQQRSLEDQVQLSTFTLFLGSEADAPIDEPDTFVSGLQAGWDAVVGFFGFLLVALGVALPWLLPIAVVLALILIAVRWRRRTTTGDDADAGSPKGRLPKAGSQKTGSDPRTND